MMTPVIIYVVTMCIAIAACLVAVFNRDNNKIQSSMLAVVMLCILVLIVTLVYMIKNPHTNLICLW